MVLYDEFLITEEYKGLEVINSSFEEIKEENIENETIDDWIDFNG